MVDDEFARLQQDRHCAVEFSPAQGPGINESGLDLFIVVAHQPAVTARDHLQPAVVGAQAAEELAQVRLRELELGLQLALERGANFAAKTKFIQ